MWNICLNSFRPWIRVLIWVTGYWHYPGKTRFNPPWSNKYDIYGAERKFQCSVSLKKNAIFFHVWELKLQSSTLLDIKPCFYMFLLCLFKYLCPLYVFVMLILFIMFYVISMLDTMHVLPWAKLEALNKKKKMHLNLNLKFSYQNSFLWLKASSSMFYLKPWISKVRVFLCLEALNPTKV